MRFSIFDWKRVSHAACGFAILFAATSTQAQSQAKWTLTTADFRSRQVDLVAIDEAGAKVADGTTQTVVKWDELLLLDREDAPRPQAGTTGKYTLWLADGEQIRGEPVKLEGEALQWNSPAVGGMSIPLKTVSAITRAAQPAQGLDDKRTEDVIRLANGDVVRGIVSGLESGTIKIQSQGNEVPVALDAISIVMLASTPGAAHDAAGRTFRVHLLDDSIITAPVLISAGDKLTLTLADGAKRDVPLAGVAGIEQLNGPVSWMSSRRPSENVQTPLLDTSRPAKMDRTVVGKPIRFGDHTFARGIGVAPYSRLTWTIGTGATGSGGAAADQMYKAFRTQYAIDGNGSYADVAVRIKLDDKIVHERKNFTAGELAPVVIVPLGAAKTLTLEVEFGANYNVQDRFNWIEPALLKASAIPPAPPKPALTTAPTTAPTAAPPASAPSAPAPAPAPNPALPR